MGETELIRMFKQAQEKLFNLRDRIILAGNNNKGCRITKEEAELLTRYDLPSTLDDFRD